MNVALGVLLGLAVAASALAAWRSASGPRRVLSPEREAMNEAARISPHFIYNSLAAIASHIHTQPQRGRELLTEFADFTRYAFRGERTYVTLADELQYVQKHLRVEHARFGERLELRVQVAPEALGAVASVLSLQPLVENAVRHGVQARAGPRLLEVVGFDRDTDVELRVSYDGVGMDEERAVAGLRERRAGPASATLTGGVRATFGEDYGLEIDPGPGGARPW